MALHIVLPAFLIALWPHFVRTTENYHFHASYKSGEKTWSPIACAAGCASHARCVGYEISNVSGCVLLTTPPAGPKDDHWIYASPERAAQVSG